jgi:hypothetical protein
MGNKTPMLAQISRLLRLATPDGGVARRRHAHDPIEWVHFWARGICTCRTGISSRRRGPYAILARARPIVDTTMAYALLTPTVAARRPRQRLVPMWPRPHSPTVG